MKRVEGKVIHQGVAIKLYQTGEERDQATDNYLLLRADINSSTVIFGSVYGPNESNPNFYVNLKNSIRRLGDHLCILGGDWNATQSCLPLTSNIDVLNMQALPNITNSKKIKEMCTELGLSDPFHVLFPNKLDYTYAPWGNTRNNRSRLDFFLTSNNIAPLVTKCWICSYGVKEFNKIFVEPKKLKYFRHIFVTYGIKGSSLVNLE
jgi:exonuclease III